MIEKVDLLAHIGASATRRDDENYRAQAKAYLDFQGHIVDQNIPTVTASLVAIANEDGTSIAKGDNTPLFLDDTQLACNALDSQLITSSFVMPSQVTIRSASASQRSRCSQDITGSPNRSRFGEVKARRKDQYLGLDERRRGLDHSASQNVDSTESELMPGVVQRAMSTPRVVPHTHPLSQSSYLKSPILDRASVNKKRRLNNNDDTSNGRSLTSVPVQPANYIDLPEQTDPDRTRIGDRVIESTEDEAYVRNFEDDGGGLRSYDTTSELPTSYSLSDITSESSRARNRINASQRSASDPGPRVGPGKVVSVEVVSAPTGEEMHATGRNDLQSATVAPIPAIATSTSSQPQRKTQEAADVPIEKPVKTKPASTNHTTAQPSPSLKPTTKGAEAQVAQTLIDALPKTIHPPSPPVGIDTYTSHLTQSLTWLATESPIKNSYRPVSVSREIMPLERGFWLLDPSSWTPRAQCDFWEYLQRVIGGGSAGWGIWCCRGDDCGEVGQVEDIGSGGDSGGGLGLVKVYCWGEVVAHVYLLLYVASKSQVRKLGLVWADAEERAVVRMRKG